MNRVSATFAPPYHIRGAALTNDPTVPRVWEGPAVSAIPPVFASPARALNARARDRRAVSRRAGGGLRRLLVPVALASVTVGSMMAVAMRERVVQRVPALGAAFAAIGLPVNLLGLAIEDVHARVGEFGLKRVLLVDGAIVNLRARDAASPALRIVLRGSDGRELYQWTTRAPKSWLAKSERVPFAARLEAPPEDVADAVVNFVDAAEISSRRGEGS